MCQIFPLSRSRHKSVATTPRAARWKQNSRKSEREDFGVRRFPSKKLRRRRISGAARPLVWRPRKMRNRETLTMRKQRQQSCNSALSPFPLLLFDSFARSMGIRGRRRKIGRAKPISIVYVGGRETCGLYKAKWLLSFLCSRLRDAVLWSSLSARIFSLSSPPMRLPQSIGRGMIGPRQRG